MLHIMANKVCARRAPFKSAPDKEYFYVDITIMNLLRRIDLVLVIFDVVIVLLIITHKV